MAPRRWFTQARSITHHIGAQKTSLHSLLSISVSLPCSSSNCKVTLLSKWWFSGMAQKQKPPATPKITLLIWPLLHLSLQALASGVTPGWQRCWKEWDQRWNISQACWISMFKPLACLCLLSGSWAGLQWSLRLELKLWWSGSTGLTLARLPVNMLGLRWLLSGDWW